MISVVRSNCDKDMRSNMYTGFSALNLDRNESQKMSTSLVLIQLNDRLRSIGGREFQK